MPSSRSRSRSSGSSGDERSKPSRRDDDRRKSEASSDDEKSRSKKRDDNKDRIDTDDETSASKKNRGSPERADRDEGAAKNRRNSSRSRSRSKSRSKSPRRKKRSRSRTRSRSRSRSRRRGSRRSRSRSSSEDRSRRRGEFEGFNEDEGYRLHIGDLDPDADKRDLEKIFGKYGPLKEIWMARSVPCFAFVVFRYREDAEDAQRKADGIEICGRRIRVTVAKPRSRNRGGRRGFDPNSKCYQCGERGHFSRDCPDGRYGYRRPSSPRRSRDY